MSGIPLPMAWILIKESLKNIRVRMFIYRPYLRQQKFINKRRKYDTGSKKQRMDGNIRRNRH